MKGPPLGDNPFGDQGPNPGEKSQGLRRRLVEPTVDEEKNAPDDGTENEKLPVHESDSETLVGDDEGDDREIAAKTSKKAKAGATAPPSPDTGIPPPNRPWWSKLAALVTGAIQRLLQNVHDWLFGDHSVPDWEKKIDDEAEKTKAQQNQTIDDLKDKFKKETQKLPEKKRGEAASYFVSCMRLVRSFGSGVEEMTHLKAATDRAWSKLQQRWAELKAACQPILDAIRSYFGSGSVSCPSG
jgi:hypothetical protein